VPLRGHSLSNGLSLNSSDIENWQPFNPNNSNKPNILINPYADTKLKHETCPFHRLKSFGFEFFSFKTGNLSFIFNILSFLLFLLSNSAESLQRNEELEFERNRERFQFLKWGANALKNTTIIPPGSGICHQVNLEYLARVVFNGENNLLYPDSVVGLDSHTTMINGLGVVGWGVGGIEAEAVMLGQSICMVLPEVVGYKLVGKLPSYTT